MRLRLIDTPQLAGDGRSSRSQLSFQMHPFVIQLPTRLANFLGASRFKDLPDVEVITAALSFGCDFMKKGSNRRHGISRTSKSEELRVIAVSSCGAAENLLREQRLSPASYEA